MSGIAINGGRSAIAQALRNHWLDPGESVVWTQRGQDMPLDARRYLFCQGLLFGKRADEHTAHEAAESLYVNYTWIANQCDRILNHNDVARICLIGSESGIAGSYDRVYADAKKRLHAYVETKRLRLPAQQLVCIAPSIIADAGMTLRRQDAANLAQRMQDHPKRRFLLADEVAGLIHYVLYVDHGYLSGVVIRMNGGAHCATPAS